MNDTFAMPSTLPDPLPAAPVAVLAQWLDEATQGSKGNGKIQPNPNAMYVATVDASGMPSVRTLLCKGIEPDPGCVLFYTNKESRKGLALAANPRVGVLFHWDFLDRQVRIEGPVVPTTEAENDAYFASRSWMSRLGAVASQQGCPVASRDALLQQVDDAAASLGFDAVAGPDDPDANGVIPRPAHWGGYRLWAQRVELWIGGPGRVHDRAQWVRELTPNGDTYTCGSWESTRLQP